MPYFKYPLRLVGVFWTTHGVAMVNNLFGERMELYAEREGYFNMD